MKFLLKKSVLLLLGLCLTIKLHGQSFNVKSFGALGNGVADDTKAIQRAIDSCAAKGGMVYFPKGVFLSSTLVLKSHVTLHLSEQSVLLGSEVAANYPYQNAGLKFYGSEWAKQALIYVNGAENISIEGRGTIDGQGAKFITTTEKKPDRYRNRPYLLWFVQCKNIKLSGVTLRNSAFWMQHYLACEQIWIEGIKIWNHSNKNNDMLDLDGCKDVMVRNVVGDADDDGITIKSTSNYVSENITIDQCVISSHCNAIKLGTESTGGFRNIRISNCVIRPSAKKQTIYGMPQGTSGLSLEMVDGGVMENIQVQGIIMDGPEVPIFIRLGNRARKHHAAAAQPGIGFIRNIRLSDISATAAGNTGCAIVGIPDACIENLSLNQIDIRFKGGGSDTLAAKLVAEMEEEYPEATMFGQLPAYGFYVRHAKNIDMNQITLTVDQPDKRAAIALDDVKQIRINALDAVLANNAPAIQAQASHGLLFSNSWLPKEKTRQVLLKGTNTKVFIQNNVEGNE